MNIPQKKQPPRMRAVKKATALAGTCATLACTGPGTEVRSSPPVPAPSAPCPRGSLEAMKELGIKEGDEVVAGIVGQVPGEWHKINKGWTTLELGGRLGKLRGSTLLSGTLIYRGNRVFGHFIQATTKESKTYPVCLEWRSTLDEDGKILTSRRVHAVNEFGEGDWTD